MNYKFSMYNHFGTLKDGSILIYNVLSSAVAIMSQEEFTSIHKEIIEKINEDFIETTIEMGFIVPEQEDELSKVLALRNLNNYNDRRAGFQILPTTGCNARCFYCYEQGFKTSTMTRETLESTVDFILGFCENMDEVIVTWFGGEPFTREDYIAEISKKLITEFDKRGTKYYVNVITNGALISEKNIDAIVEDYRISSFQITLDGRNENHMKRKRFLDKSVSYQTILNNIALLTKRGIQVMVRINADRSNLEDCLRIFDDLEALDAEKDYLWPYVAPLYSSKNKPNQDCFRQEELTAVYTSVYKKMIDTGFIQTVDGLPMNFSNATCCAKVLNNYVISPEGEISKCEHLLNEPEEVIGHVATGIMFNSAMAKWSDSGIPDECKKCAYLPICQAGCTAAEICGFGYGRCSYITFIHDAVIEAASYLIERNERK